MASTSCDVSFVSRLKEICDIVYAGILVQGKLEETTLNII